MRESIEHDGVIVSAQNASAKVLIEQTSACAGCHAKSACSAFDKAEKIIDAIIDVDDVFNVGERVIIRGKKSIGLKAVLIAFVLPFVLILAVLALSLCFTVNEGIAALISLASLVPYYLTIFILRDKIQREFKFYVYKASSL